MVHSTVAAHMLPGPHDHVLRGRHVYHRRFSRITIGDPYSHREAIGCAAKGDGQGAAEEQQQRRSSIFIRVDLSARCERRVTREHLGCVVVCTLDVRVLAGEDAVQPVEHLFGHRAHTWAI